MFFLLGFDLGRNIPGDMPSRRKKIWQYHNLFGATVDAALQRIGNRRLRQFQKRAFRATKAHTDFLAQFGGDLPDFIVGCFPTAAMRYE